ncbi:MAG: serine/threonine protein kinase [Planctomycetia bacterium]|nr:serine/threonine protein kinase [Planctomycetia bacterium]
MMDDRPRDDDVREDSARDDSEPGRAHDDAIEPTDVKLPNEPDAASPLDPHAFTQTFDFKDDRAFAEFKSDEDDIEYKTLGKYRIVERLGSGGMGVVYKAYDDGLRRWVAIKTLNRTLSEAVVARRRFIREARAAAAVRHPNVVTIHAVEEQDGVPFIVMEYIDGCTLRDLRRDGQTLTPMHILGISVQVAAGLAAAHVQGVIHRDVKPGNIMLEGEERVVLTDFGLARAAVDNVELTSGAMPLGTPAYMSPEQVNGATIDARSDLFSFGCVLYAMFVGHSPFQGQNALEVARKVTELVPRPLVDVHPRTPPFLSEIVERLLEKNPARRYQSSLELLDVLNGHLAQLNQTPTDEFSTVLYRKAQRSRRSPRWLAIASGGLLVVLLSALLFLKPWEFDRALDEPIPTGGEQVTLVPRTIEVGKNRVAEFDSIRLALEAAAPGSTIRVIDDGTYTERIELNGTSQLLIEAVSDPPATLIPLDPDTAIIGLANVEEITIRGFRLAADKLHAIVLQENCQSVTLDNLQLNQSKLGTATSLLLVDGDATVDSLTISNCHFVVEGHGQAIWISDSNRPLSNLRIERNRFQAEFTHLAIMRPLRSSVVTHNTFANGKNGINLSLVETGSVELPENCLQITNNTMVGVEFWIGMLGTIAQRENYGTIANNLLVDCGRLQGSPEEIEKALSSWRCQANYWQHPPIKPEDQDRVKKLDLRMTSQLESMELMSKDPKDPQFGVPIEGDSLYTAGVGGELPLYIGAQGPASEVNAPK